MTADTGDSKMDEAYKRLELHIKSFESFEEFYRYFMKIKKTDNDKTLIKWLLKVLFVQLRITNNKKHKFDLLIEKINDKERATMENWFDEKLKKVGIRND